MTVVLSTIAALRAQTKAWRDKGETIALAPTMGALHAGHVSLIERARRGASRTIASVFVNPTQFGPGEDFARYPRTFDDDLAKLRAAAADAVFHPAPDEIYPPGFATSITLGGPARVGLEDAFRPTHFQGVATVVAKLLMLAQPDIAIFGEKDFQQLAVIRKMVADLGIPVTIDGAPIVREPDGLALSSRNVYLDPRERAIAPQLFATLQNVAWRLGAGEPPHAALDDARENLEKAGFALDYLELRDAGGLGEAQAGSPARLLVAARLGRTRLIDNVAVGGLSP